MLFFFNLKKKRGIEFHFMKFKKKGGGKKRKKKARRKFK